MKLKRVMDRRGQLMDLLFKSFWFSSHTRNRRQWNKVALYVPYRNPCTGSVMTMALVEEIIEMELCKFCL